jgi:hypothetical protein
LLFILGSFSPFIRVHPFLSVADSRSSSTFIPLIRSP